MFVFGTFMKHAEVNTWQYIIPTTSWSNPILPYTKPVLYYTTTDILTSDTEFNCQLPMKTWNLHSNIYLAQQWLYTRIPFFRRAKTGSRLFNIRYVGNYVEGLHISAAKQFSFSYFQVSTFLHLKQCCLGQVMKALLWPPVPRSMLCGCDPVAILSLLPCQLPLTSLFPNATSREAAGQGYKNRMAWHTVHSRGLESAISH